MRIVQLIDSLEAGGAERMAVSYANALSNKIEFSGLIATRNEGALKEQVTSKVAYRFLAKKNNLDAKAFLKFRKFIIKNKVQIIHAHSSSFFWATLLKVSHPNIKIIWHDHFGNRIQQENSTTNLLKLCSRLFYGCISVNEDLRKWAVLNLKCKKVIYLPNFITETVKPIQDRTFLKGIEGKRIVFLANLKKPKNHLSILKAFKSVHEKHTDWSIHLIGKEYNDKYSKDLHEYIKEFNLQSAAFTYGSCNDISNILQQAKVGVLGSTYEGFPVTLLEYGKASLIVMSTNVGDCAAIITNYENGILFDPFNQIEMAEVLDKLISSIENNEKNILALGGKLNERIDRKYSQEIVLKQYIKFLK